MVVRHIDKAKLAAEDVPSEIVVWLATGATMALFVFFIWRSFALLKPGRAASHIQLEYGQSLRSACIFICMAVPPLLFHCEAHDAEGTSGEGIIVYSWHSCPQSPYWFIPTNLMRIYNFLPFFYAFVVCTHVGNFLEGSRDALVGTLLSVFAMAVLNSFMPGGAGVRSQDATFVANGLLGAYGGYNRHACFIAATTIVYTVFLSNANKGTQQYLLASFTGMLVPFMNPDTKGFRCVILDWDLDWNWNGHAMCEIWIVLLSILFSALTFGMNPFSRKPIQKFTNTETAVAQLMDLATDTEGCLEWLLTSSVANFDADSSYFYIRELGRRRSQIEKHLSQATWECHTKTQRARLQVLWKFAELLRHLRQVLRVELEHMRSKGQLQPRYHEDLLDFLEEFLVSCGDALSCFAGCCKADDDAWTSARKEVLKATKNAGEALSKALHHLDAQRKASEANSLMFEMAFIDRLRSWPLLIERSIQELDQVDVDNHSEGWRPWFGWRERRGFALRNTLSWVLSLVWSIYKRGYVAGCVVSTSLIFSSTSGSSFHTNINRMVGVGMGLAIGNVPAFLVMPYGGGLDTAFYAERVAVYIVVMFVMWSMAMYGYLATGSKYSYACLLWVGYGGVQTISHIPNFDRKKNLFLDILDNFLSCLIVFLVDMFFAYITGTGTSEQAKTAIVKCVEDMAMVVDCLKTGKAEDVEVNRIQEDIKAARFWDGEVRQEGLVWTTLVEAPYSVETVPVLLDHCDEVYVALYAIQSSSKRCKSEATAAKIIRDGLRETVSEEIHLQVKATRAMLNGGVDPEPLQALLLQGRDRADSDGNRKLSKEPLTEGLLREDSLTDFLDDIKEANSGKMRDSNTLRAEAAANAVRLSTIALRMALRRIEGLLAAGTALASKEWRAAPMPENNMSEMTKDDAASRGMRRRPSLLSFVQSKDNEYSPFKENSIKKAD